MSLMSAIATKLGIVTTLSSQPASLAEERREVARSRIIRAARAQLAERGLSTTVDDIALAAHVSRRTVFRHFETREGLLAAALEDSLHSYQQHMKLTPPDEDADVDAWLASLLHTAHRLNARNGRAYLELAANESDLTGEIAAVTAERRHRRADQATWVATQTWRAHGGRGNPPHWVIDAFAIHLSGFTTASLSLDFGRSPDDVAMGSARVLRATVEAALAAAR
ncbi:MAG: hypothetical protein RLZZ623_3782 [Actinomycetota bacterium]|jgi:AcrR family transcriptional regulator